jgi:hypothetical protein
LATKWVKGFRCWTDFYRIQYPNAGGQSLLLKYGDGYAGDSENWQLNLGGPACASLGKCRQTEIGLPSGVDIEADFIFADDYPSYVLMWKNGYLSTPTKQ